MKMCALMTLPALAAAATAVGPCKTDLDCSLNGVCSAAGNCKCDRPWGGPGCGVLQYKLNQPLSAKDLYPFNNTAGPLQPCVTPTGSCDALNTWNGPIVGPVEGKYHMYNPLYRKGSLLATTAMLHGVATNITGPYEWQTWPDMGSNPAAVVYSEGAATKYALFSRGVRLASSPDGPFDKTVGPSPGGNPAPVYHKGVWYATSQSTTEVVTTPKLGQKWSHFSDIVPKLSSGTQEDPFMYIDRKGNWHVINHAYDTSQWKDCGSSTLSAHVFSKDGKDWHMLKPDVHPYTHQVHYEDGTTHSYSTLERPNLHFNEAGQMTHINLAANMETQDAGCAAYKKCPAIRNGHCACTNCKYADHAGSIIIALDYE